MTVIDGYEVFPWDEIAGKGWEGLLIGNGASMAVWPSFGYKTLFEQATEQELAHPLTNEDTLLFEQFRTTNFERILSALLVANQVGVALHIDDRGVFNERYESIRRALFEAIRYVHLPWQNFPDDIRRQIKQELLRYPRVYSTNYDLLIYWSMMIDGDADEFRDFFWTLQGEFNPRDTRVWGKKTELFYLHGGVHLYRTESGQTYKRFADERGNLLNEVTELHGNIVVPLLVSEGNANQKLTSIKNSDYLTFCYNQFSSHDGPLVIFGHSLDENDEHLLSAVRGFSEPKIAISINSNLSRREKAAYIGRAVHVFPDIKKCFFESNTHPLGAQNMRVEPD